MITHTPIRFLCSHRRNGRDAGYLRSHTITLGRLKPGRPTRRARGRSADWQSALGATNGSKLLGMAHVKSRLPASAPASGRGG